MSVRVRPHFGRPQTVDPQGVPEASDEIGLPLARSVQRPPRALSEARVSGATSMRQNDEGAPPMACVIAARTMAG